MHAQTVATDCWLAENLCKENPHEVSRKLSQWLCVRPIALGKET
jgi:hypothetical protein